MRNLARRLFVGACLSLTAPAVAGLSYRWMRADNERGLVLTYGADGTDSGLYDLICKDRMLNIGYSSQADQTQPYGTKLAAKVRIDAGNGGREFPASATFDEGGEPALDIPIADPSGFLRLLRTAKRLRTKDRWNGSLSAPAPAPVMLSRFAAQCGFRL